MCLTHTLDLRQQQTQRITPHQILASEILAWTGAEVEAAIERVCAENPALEWREGLSDSNTEFSSGPQQTGANEIQRHVTPSYASSSAPDVFERVSGTVTLREHLRNQIGLVAPASVCPQADRIFREVVAYLIESLDERGYLVSVDSVEVAERFGVRRGVVEQAVWALHTMEPAGVGARDLRECLCLQAEQRRQTEDLPPLVHTLLVRCWDDLVANRDDRIAQRLHASLEEVRIVRDFLRRSFTPDPGAAFAGAGTARVGSDDSLPALRPDLVFERTPDGLVAILPNGDAHTALISPAWRTLADTPLPSRSSRFGGDTLRQYARELVGQAESFVNGLARRGTTLKRIADALIEHQAGFVETGNRASLQPLTRQTLAAALRLDESVVSRAVADKWARLPSGEIVPLDAFFGAAHAVRETLAQLIAAEDPRAPLSDDALVERLADAGFVVARRTVAKYRGAERILPARLRRVGVS